MKPRTVPEVTGSEVEERDVVDGVLRRARPPRKVLLTLRLEQLETHDNYTVLCPQRAVCLFFIGILRKSQSHRVEDHLRGFISNQA